MSKSQRRAKRKVLHVQGTLAPNGAEYEDSMIGRDSGQLLLTHDSLVAISNAISR